MKVTLNSLLFRLHEGGNVFKGDAATQRINKAEVVPTVKFLEKITGLSLVNRMLGTTGRKETSGDLDLAVDEREITKDELVSRLSQKFPATEIKKAGTNVHLRTPINGNPSDGFVQTDFMFGDPEFLGFSMQGGGSGSPFKGAHRHILLSSIAKPQGLKWSPNRGLIDRATDKVITTNPDEIARRLLGPTATAADVSSVESVMKAIKSRPDREELVAQAREHFAKEDGELPSLGWTETTLREFLFLSEGMEARIQHPEALVVWEGSRGASRALLSLLALARSPESITVKWDGSPAIFFGRDELGQFILTDKSGFSAKGYQGKATSPEELEQMLVNRAQKTGKPPNAVFVSGMKQVFDAAQKAFPPDLVGWFFKGDLLYQSRPEVVRGEFVFTPNVTTYRVPVDTDLGRKIAASRVGVVVHGLVNSAGDERAVGDIGSHGFDESSGFLVVPPVSVTEPPTVDVRAASEIKHKVVSSAGAVDAMLSAGSLRAQKLSDFPDLLYKFINSKAGALNEITPREFLRWAAQDRTLSEPKKNNVQTWSTEHREGLDSLFEIVRDIEQLKNDIVEQLDRQDTGVRASIGNREGGEGYVAGDIKLVNRAGFTAANRAVVR